jgi:hypothetical protein
MKLVMRSRTGAPAPSFILPFAAFAAGAVALAGCGGSVYNLGNVPGDAGDGGDGGQPATASQACFGGNDCDAGSGAASNGNGFGFDDAGESVVGTTPDAGSTVSANGGCAVTALTCPVGATSYTCTDNDDPWDGEPGLSCSFGTWDGNAVDYCCFPWPGVGGPCSPYATFPCDDTSYGYQCTPGTTPPQVDAKLSCGSAFPDSNGNSDYCCTYQ